MIARFIVGIVIASGATPSAGTTGKDCYSPPFQAGSNFLTLLNESTLVHRDSHVFLVYWILNDECLMSNDEMMSRNQVRLLLPIVLGVVVGALLVVAVAPGVSAHTWRAGESIVPQCSTNWDATTARFTNPCTLCDLLDLVAHIVNFIIWTAFAVAGILVVVAGFIILTAESSGREKFGKEMITKVIIGIVIMLLSYLIVMVILWVLLPNPTAPNTRAQFRIGVGGFEIQCNPAVRSGTSTGSGTGGRPPEISPPVLPGPGTGAVDVNRWCPGTLAEREQRVCGRVNAGVPGATIERCLTELRTANPVPKLLLAIIEKESGGFPGTENEVFNITEGRRVLSCGVAQLSTATARDVGRRLGIGGIPDVNDRDTCEWLKSNPIESIQMAGKLLQERAIEAVNTSIRNGYALSGPEVSAAAYNGGPRANDPSRNCTPTETPDTCRVNPDGKKVPRWACPFDKPTGGSCVDNEGYSVTRDYVAIVSTCAARP